MSDIVQACFCLVLCAAALWVVLGGRRAVWPTTLRAGWCWVVLTLLALSGVEMILVSWADLVESQAELLRYATAVFAFTPTMALLGAKRPQNVAWQFVVITLWCVLALPSFELWMRGRGEVLVLDVVRSWFLVVMIAVGAVNHLPTRFALAAAQVAVAQAVLFWPLLPFVASSEGRPPTWIACGFFLTAALTAHQAAHFAHRHAPVRENGQPMPGWSRVWHEFRDWYGTVWGVRVMERVNASAAMHGWPIALDWNGFAFRETSQPALENRPLTDSGNVGVGGAEAATHLTADEMAAIQQSLRSLLRRFVSSEWIAARHSAD
jgi:hypothetical protein